MAATSSFLNIVNTESETESVQQAERQQSVGSGADRLQPVSLPPELNRDIWKKAWETWNGIGTECVCRRLPALEGLDSVLKAPVKMERVDQFFLSIPSQKFLTNLLTIFLHLHDRLRAQLFAHSDFRVLARVLHAALPMPVAKDVSPFLVPSSNENVMSTLQELVLQCMGVVVSKATVFDDPGSRTDEVKTLLVKKPHVIDIHRVLSLATDQHEVSFYPLVISELLEFSLLATKAPAFLRGRKGIPPSSLPFMFVNYVPFGLGAQALATQLYRSCVMGGVSLPATIPQAFLKVQCTLYI